MGQVHRLAMIVEAVSNAITVLQKIENSNIKKTIYVKFIRKVDIHLKETRYAKVISDFSTKVLL